MLQYVQESRKPVPLPKPDISDTHRMLRNKVGMTLLLGLEVLVATDIVKTVAIQPDFNSVGVPGLLVLVRTFLSWTLTLENEGALAVAAQDAGRPCAGTSRVARWQGRSEGEGV